MFYYIHIPFCQSKCKYCNFASFAGQEKLKNKYLEHLKEEIDSQLGIMNYELGIDSIYFGGGTPSILLLEEVSSIIEVFKSYGDISNSEITFECNPQNINKNYLDGLYNIGINRLSIGIQSLNKKTLKEIGRCDLKKIKEALSYIENSKFDNVSIDFILGLPFEKTGEKLNQIQFILDNYSKIKHTSLYMLEEGEYPSNWKNVSIKDKDYLNEYNEIYKYLEKTSFKRYEISNFANKGFECKHNMAYWEHKEYIGFGLGASSFIGNTRKTNARDFENYFGKKGIYEENLGREELKLEKMMFQIRTSGISSLDIKDKNIVGELKREGLINIKNKKITLSKSGLLLADFILSKLI